MNQDYRHIWSEKRSLINVESHLRQYTEQRDILGSTHNTSFIYARNGVAEEFHKDADNKKWIELGKNFLDKNIVATFLSGGETLRNDFFSFISELKDTDLQQLSNTKLEELFIRACQFHSRLRGFFKVTRGEFLSTAEKKLKELLFEKLNNEPEVVIAFEKITTPATLDNVNQELVEWANLLSYGTNIEESISRHLTKYPWLIAHSYNINEIMGTMLKKHVHDCHDLNTFRLKVNNIMKSKDNLRKEQQRLLQEFGNEAIIYFSWLFQEFSLERMRLKGGWAGSDFLYLPLYNEISRRTKIPLRELYSFYRIGEVLNAIKNNKPILSSQELERRDNAYVLRLQEGKINFYSGPEAEIIILEELQHIKKNEEEGGLRGRIACRGLAQGIVRIIIPGDISMLSQAMHNFQGGEVLVTTMTQPNMVPLIEKASAIITDEGGLTSHAAIISREFKTPCIVGTEIATKVFKDGDLVEVDADKGIVRKIKRQ